MRSIKIGYACTICGDKPLQKKGTWPLWIAHIKEKKAVTFTVVRITTGWFTKLLLNLLNLRNLFGVWKMLKEGIFNHNNYTNSTDSTRTWVLSTQWTRTRSSTGMICEWKNDGRPRLLEWSMLFFRMRRCCIVLTKMKTMSLCLSFSKRCCQCNFSKIFERRYIILEPCRNSKCPMMSVKMTQNITNCLLENKVGVRCAK